MNRLLVRLETSDGAHVHDGEILPYVTGYPKILVWGIRVFLLDEDAAYELADAPMKKDERMVYRETFYAAVLPDCLTPSER